MTDFGDQRDRDARRFEGGEHFHDEQEELYFVHAARSRCASATGLRTGWARRAGARVDPATIRRLPTWGEDEATFVVAGGKDGYVGRDGRLPEGARPRLRGRGGGAGSQ